MQYERTRDIAEEADLLPARGLAAWMGEIRTTLALAWPLILTNLAQTGMTTTDVVMMGRLGPEALAAGSLGFNVYFAILIFGIGVMSAASPLIAAERGRNRHAVREVRRTVRQGLWAALAISVPSWFVLWHGEAILLVLGQDPHLSALAGSYLRTLQWGMLPFLGYLVLRSFSRRMERPRWALAAVHRRVRVQRLRELGADVRQSRLSGAGTAGVGPRDHAGLLGAVRGRCGRAVCWTGASGATACSAVSGGRTGSASAITGGSACRSARRWPSR